LEELIQDSFKQALEQEEITALGNYNLRSSFDELVEKFIPGVPLSFQAAVDVAPSVVLGDYKALSVKAEETLYDPQSVEDWLQQRREQQADLVPIEDRPAERGDVAIVDYQAYALLEDGSKGEAIADIKGTDFKIDLEEGRFVEGMVEGIVGTALDENKDITVVFPDDYPLETVAGQSVIFNITLKEIKAKELPELDDDFAGEVSEYATLAELRESLEKQYQEEAEEQTNNSIDNAILDALLTVGEIDLPDTLVQEEITRVLQQTALQMEQMGLDIRQLFGSEHLTALRENARPEAVERLKQALIVQEIAKIEDLKPEAEALTARINEIRTQLAGQTINQEKLTEVVTEELTSKKVLELLRNQIQVERVPKGTLNPPDEEDVLEAEVSEVVEAIEAEVSEVVEAIEAEVSEVVEESAAQPE
jgi:trigger factor